MVDIPAETEIGRPGKRWTFVSIESVLIFVDRKSTRLNSSHSSISYAVFCLKKKNMPNDLSQLGFLAGQIGRLILISTTPVISGVFFEMAAVGALRLSRLRRGLAIYSTVAIV